MKFEKNNSYFTIAVYALFVLLFAVAAVFIGIYWLPIRSAVRSILSIFKPLIYGFIFAFLFNPIEKFAESWVFNRIGRKKNKTKLRRVLSMILTYLIVLGLIAFILFALIPQISASYRDFSDRVNDYLPETQKWIENLVEPSAFFKEQYNNIVNSLKDLIVNSYNLLEDATPYVINFITGFVTETKNILLGIIISVYFLFAKDRISRQADRLLSAIFNEKHCETIERRAKYTHRIFSEFINGKLIDSIIVGLLCFIVMSISGMPYALFVSVIITAANIIPFIGPFLGAVPGAIIIFLAKPQAALWFILMIIALQQIDNHLIEPQFLKTRTDIGVVWMLISIIVMGGLFGFIGMLIAVPTFAVIYKFTKEFSERRLAKKGLPTDTDRYL